MSDIKAEPFIRETENGKEYGVELSGGPIDELRDILKQQEWDEYFIKMARLVASKSRDKSTKCGCVIVGPDREIRSTGYNGLPRGVGYTDDREERPAKYRYFCHAEENAVANAARMGMSLKECSAYVSGPPCCACARGLIQAGIREVVIPELHEFRSKAHDERWKESIDAGLEMFNESGVVFREVEGI